jgi:iron only hydrogenase large subunit-like protein
MVAALRKLGFDKVFDTDFAADLTINIVDTVEFDAYELVDRVTNPDLEASVTVHQVCGGTAGERGRRSSPSY